MKRRVVWSLLLFTAFALRAAAPDWDGGIAAHPDERFLLGAAEATPMMGNVCRTTPDFPYGHLPIVLAHLLSVAAPEADSLLPARLLSSLVGVVLVALTGACAASVGGEHAGFLAGVLAALSPGLIQQAHFFTVDPIGAAFASAAALSATRGRWRLSGMLVGLAVACKASLAVTALPLAILAFLRGAGFVRLHRRGSGFAGRLCLVRRFLRSLVQRSPMNHLPVRQRLRDGVVEVLHFSVPALASFAMVSPWALLTPVVCWRGPVVQSMLVSGRYVFPYTQQYVHTLPLIYPLLQMALWGLGPGVVIAGAFALLWWSPISRRGIPSRLCVSWLWMAFTFIVVGSLRVKFPRYMLPLYPWWIAWAAVALAGWWRRLGRGIRWLALFALVLPTTIQGLAQVGLYSVPHPWPAASQYLYATLDSSSVVAVEAWDHPLPVPLPGHDPTALTQLTLPVYAEEDADKAQQLTTALDGDVVVLASRRGYGALSREPKRYRDTLIWYAHLLGSYDVMTFTRCPRIGPLALTDDPLADAGLSASTTLAERCGTPYALRLPRLDESYRVYDAPLTLLVKLDPQ